MRYTPSGAAVCNVTIATSRNWKDKTTGDKVEETEWHRVVFYDRLAEIAGEYLKKGGPVYVEGRLKTRKWDKEGKDNYTTEVIADNMQMLGGREGHGRRRRGRRLARPCRGSGGWRASGVAPAGRQTGCRAGGRSSTGFDDMDDDIPF